MIAKKAKTQKLPYKGPFPKDLQKIVDESGVVQKKRPDRYWDEATQSYKSRKEEEKKKRRAAEADSKAKGYSTGGVLKGKKNKVRGVGIARKGVRPAKML